jgi:predicted nucleic acid-binding protein
VIYADTSFLVALYINEEETETARAYMERSRTGLAFTPFHRLELRTALRLRVFRNEVGRDFLRESFRQIDSDLQEGILSHTRLDWNNALREAEEISASHLLHIGARSGDLLHVASAVVLDASEFCTFDERQTALARRAGLKVAAWS